MQRILQVLDEEKLATKAPDILGSIGRALCAKKRLALVIAKNAEVQKNALSIADPAEFLDALFVADVHAEVDRQYRESVQESRMVSWVAGFACLLGAFALVSLVLKKTSLTLA